MKAPRLAHDESWLLKQHGRSFDLVVRNGLSMIKLRAGEKLQVGDVWYPDCLCVSCREALYPVTEADIPAGRVPPNDEFGAPVARPLRPLIFR